MVYSRTGQYEKAEQILAKEGSSRSRFRSVLPLLLAARIGSGEGVLRTPSRVQSFDLFDQYWVRFLLGDIERGIDHLEEEVARGAHPAVFRSNIGEVLPQSMLRKVEQHPRYQAMLKRFGIDAAWCDELMAIANDLSAITGIRVQPDDDY